MISSETEIQLLRGALQDACAMLQAAVDGKGTPMDQVKEFLEAARPLLQERK